MQSLAEALYTGGIRFMEVTFSQKEEHSYKETAAAIRLLTECMGGAMYIGAGTVLTVEQVDLAAEAGASFIISPDTNERVIRHTRSSGLISMPGACTPTEIQQAHVAGADFVKLFPAGPLGTDYFKGVCAPLNHMKLMAVGGIDESNLKDFLEIGACGAGIGGNLVKKADILEKRFDRITSLAKRLTGIVREFDEANK